MIKKSARITNNVRHYSLAFQDLLHVAIRISGESQVVVTRSLIELYHHRVSLADGDLQNLSELGRNPGLLGGRSYFHLLCINIETIGSINVH